MAITLVQSTLCTATSGSGTTGVTTLHCTGAFPSPTVAGNTIIVHLVVAAQGTPPSGNQGLAIISPTAAGLSFIHLPSGFFEESGIFGFPNDFSTQAFAAVNSPSVGPSNTITAGVTVTCGVSNSFAAQCQFALYEFSGIDSVDSAGNAQNSKNDKTTGGTADPGSVTNSVANELIISYIAGDPANGTETTAGSGYTLGQTMSTARLGQLQWKIGSSGSNSTAFAAQLATYWCGGAQSFLPSAGPSCTVLPLTNCTFSLGDAITALSQRLFDLTNQFWTQAELTLYIQEALRTWNALTAFWRGDFNFNTSPTVVWYDITNLTTAPNTLRAETLRAVDVFTPIEYHLLEPAVGIGAWTGSSQFTLADIQAAVTRRRDEMLEVTGCQLTRITVPATTRRTSLPNNVTSVRRIAYIDPSGNVTVLWQDDQWSLQSFQGSFTTAPGGVPSVYAISTEPWLTFDVDCPISPPGTFELLVLTSGDLTSGLECFPFDMPDDWVWVLKWGALADLLGRESNAKDLPRAQYCEKRYKQGLALLSAAPAILAARSDNVPIQVDAVKSADEYQTSWESATAGPPSEALMAGLNLIAISPPPDAGPGNTNYSITLTVVENAPVPSLTTDCMNVGRDLFDIIIDYAQHVAMFKCGGAEFAATMPLLQRFLHEATLYVGKFQELGQFYKVLYDLSQRESDLNPRYTADTDPAAEASN